MYELFCSMSLFTSSIGKKKKKKKTLPRRFLSFSKMLLTLNVFIYSSSLEVGREAVFMPILCIAFACNYIEGN